MAPAGRAMTRADGRAKSRGAQMAKRIAIDDPGLGPLTHDAITRDFRVYQRRDGHRFSVDDVATAFVACRAVPTAARVLDLGSGLGSVLALVAWRMPGARLAAIEAQDASFELLRRNVDENGLAARTTLVHGDLRDAANVEVLAARGPFDLVTGTPPYFPIGTALSARDAQREHARIEHRGGVEAYLATASRLVDARGVVVICGAAAADARVRDAAATERLALLARADLVAQADKPVLFSIWTLAREGVRGVPGALSDAPIRIRGASGELLEGARALREFSGFG